MIECCSNRSHGLEFEDINGTCPECGQPTVDGEAFDHCDYSPVECYTCGWAPCDGSC